jgi:hypothetical protein
MNDLKRIFLALFLCICVHTSAQNSLFRWGAKTGLNLSTAFVNDASESKFKSGCHAGLTAEYLLPCNFRIQSEFLFSTKGSVQEKLNGSGHVPRSPAHTFNQLYIELPIYAAYKITVSNDVDILFGAGPYLAFGVGGKIKHELHSGAWNDGITQREWDTFGDGRFDEAREWLKGETLNRFDFGAGIKADVEYNKYVLGAGASSGIRNIGRGDEYIDVV